MAETTDNNTGVATGFSWGTLADKGIEVLPELAGVFFGKQTAPTAQPTSLNPANPAGTGTAATAAAAGNTTLILAIAGGAAAVLLGVFLFAGRRR
jgi:hypothetical protein